MDNIIEMDDLIKRQNAMDAYQQRLNEMQKMDMRKKKEELDQAKLGKVDADIFKTKVSTQKTIYDAQRALQQIQMQQQQMQQPQPAQQQQMQPVPEQQQPMQVQAAARKGYAGTSDGKLSTNGGALSLQIDADKLFGKADKLPAFKRISGIADYYTEKNKGATRPQKLIKDAGIGSYIKDALKLENRLGWTAVPGAVGALAGAGLGAAYSDGDPKYMGSDIATGAIIGGGLGGLLGHNYGATKLRSMMGGPLDNPKDAFSLSKMNDKYVKSVLDKAKAVPDPPSPTFNSMNEYLAEQTNLSKKIDQLLHLSNKGKGGVKIPNLSPTDQYALAMKEIEAFNVRAKSAGMPLLAPDLPHRIAVGANAGPYVTTSSGAYMPQSVYQQLGASARAAVGNPTIP